MVTSFLASLSIWLVRAETTAIPLEPENETANLAIQIPKAGVQVGREEYPSGVGEK